MTPVVIVPVDDVAHGAPGADRRNGSGIMEALVGLDRLTAWRRRLQTAMDDVLAVRDAR
ncbi:MAG: hypothetical protein HYU25_19075 [Candidatus Rokubacteria bacterium]|nr:hypothetical protein [Candidatus Rokubacteria bacterium]